MLLTKNASKIAYVKWAVSQTQTRTECVIDLDQGSANFFVPWPYSKLCLSFGSHFHLNNILHVLKNYSEGWTKGLTGPDLARGPFFAHSWSRINLGKGSEIFSNWITSDHFWSEQCFWGSRSSSENWLKSKIKLSNKVQLVRIHSRFTLHLN